MKKKFVTLLLLICGIVACSQVAFAAGGSASTPVDLGQVLPIWSCIPFAGLLLCIAICPLIKPEWWEKNQPIVIIFWSLLFLIPFGIAYGGHIALEHLLDVIVGDYLTFIVLLFGLFCVAGNIALEGDLAGTPKVNLVMLLIGTLLSSWVGTTGASMIMIRPLIRANQWRSHKVHVMVFFIFLVSNIGGCLTPVGDPPLLMGFMHGIPFFWTLRLAPVLLLNAAILLTIFFIIDHRDYKKDLFMGRTPVTSETKKPLHLAGAHNIIYLIVIVGAVILSGTLPSLDVFQTADGAVCGIPIFGDVTLTYPALIEVVIILAAAFLSFKTTKKEVRTENHFSWGAIQEVAVLFIGIFITMIPALLILKAKGAGLGLDQPYQMFWITGLLSSFLDNTPTYLVFLTTAGTLGATAGVATTVGMIPTVMLEAISCGAIFMGANTYIGNAPNFMVRSIAEENGIKMPSFFGYIFWSLRYLIPVFVLDMLIFFL
jgi:Na+/H+ antiporter NhaD/arsenite permease-like protein